MNTIIRILWNKNGYRTFYYDMYRLYNNQNKIIARTIYELSNRYNTRLLFKKYIDIPQSIYCISFSPDDIRYITDYVRYQKIRGKEELNNYERVILNKIRSKDITNNFY